MPTVPEWINGMSARADELCTLLTTWANQNSGSDHAKGLAAMFDLLADRFRSVGAVDSLPASEGPGRLLRVRFRPHARQQILFSGHYDTVYGAAHPFQTCTLLSADKLQGPGVADMKGGLVVMLAALEAFQNSPGAEQVGGEILLTPDEETGSAGSRDALEEAARNHAFALVFEPGRENGRIVRARMGTGVFTIEVRGRSAHAGRGAADGRNAILALAEYLPQIANLPEQIPGTLLNVGRISGGSAVNVVPDRAQAEINVRTSRAGQEELVLQKLRELAAPINAREGFALSIEGKFNRGPKLVTPRDEQLFAAWNTAAAELNVALDWQDVPGGSDGNLLSAAGLPCLDGLGPVGGNLHSPTEYVLPSTLVQRAQIAALFLHHLATGKA
jgi:glutamate carboxypeptidase